MKRNLYYYNPIRIGYSFRLDTQIISCKCGAKYLPENYLEANHWCNYFDIYKSKRAQYLTELGIQGE